MQQSRLARSRHPSDGYDHIQRDGQIDALEIVFPCAFDFDLLRAGFSTCIRQLDPQILGKVTPRERRRILGYLLIVSRGNHFATALACTRTKIQNAVRSPHDVGIVFHDEDRISQVAQIMKDFDQPVCVAAVQANRWLIEHIQRSHQARPQRSCELDSLRLAPRQS